MKEYYAETIALTQLYLAQEYELEQRVFAEKHSYEFFKNYVLSKRAQPSTPMKPPAPVPIQKEEVQMKQEVAVPAPPIPKASPTTTPVVAKTEPPLPASPPSAPPKIEKPANNNKFVLEPLGPAEAVDLTGIRKIAKEHVALIDTIPDDSEAKRVNKGWDAMIGMVDVAILSFNENAKHQAFLKNVGIAIETLGCKSQLMSAQKIEQEKGWTRLLDEGKLRLVIASDYGIYTLPELLKQHREVPKQAKHFLGKIPLFLLSDIAFYLKEPSLKPSLWKALKELLSP